MRHSYICYEIFHQGRMTVERKIADEEDIVAVRDTVAEQ